MAAKRHIKTALDALMTLGLLFQMGYQLYAETAHEWAQGCSHCSSPTTR